jgi:hypothetical protein
VNETLTGSASEMKCCNIIVAREASKIQHSGLNKSISSSTPISLSGGTVTPLISFKLPSLINGDLNRISMLPINLQSFSTNKPYYLKYIYNGTLTNDNFIPNGNTILVDQSATSVSGGLTLETAIIPNGFFRLDVDNSTFKYLLSNELDGTVNTITLAAVALDATGDTDISFVIRWLEII